MEIRETTTTANKNDYTRICLYIKQVESINLPQLYKALTGYLSLLTSPEAEEYLNVYAEHLTDNHSWLTKAQCLAQAEAQREFVDNQIQAAESALDKSLWEDASKKLSYLIGTWDTDVYAACQQIISGISMLINESIPLSEVQGEITEFAQGRGVSQANTSQQEAVQRLTHLLHDSWVNSVTALSKLSRTVVLQAELFLNRLVQSDVDFTQLDTRQAFLFEANYKLCEFVKTQAQRVREAINNFHTLLAAKMVKKLERTLVEPILQRYESCSVPMITEEPSFFTAQEEAYKTDNNFDIETEEADHHEFSNSEPAQESRVEAKASKTPSEALEQWLLSSEQLLESVIKQVSLHRLQLSCSSRIKACYSKFSLFPLFRQVATKLTHYETALSNALTELAEADEINHLKEECTHRLHAVKQALENNLTRVGTYLNTLNVHHADYSVTNEIPQWQSKLYDLILGSSEDELVTVDSRLQRIEVMDSPYLRATLVMKLDMTKLKLNDMIIANMQSWSSRLVDRETVVNTLNYLGIRLHPSHLNKIAPNIRIQKKRIPVKKDFYENALDYSITAFKQVRAWLDKRVMN